MSIPKRIQRKRTKGWRMPSNAVYVGRRTMWGNPFKVGSWIQVGDAPAGFVTAQLAVDLFRWMEPPAYEASGLTLLRGKDLACWCPLDSPCHADVLLERLRELWPEDFEEDN